MPFVEGSGEIPETTKDIGVDFGLAAKSMSESLRNIQWIDSLKRNGLKGGSASDGQGGLHPIEVRASIGCAFACASNGSFQLHPMDIKSRIFAPKIALRIIAAASRPSLEPPLSAGTEQSAKEGRHRHWIHHPACRAVA